MLALPAAIGAIDERQPSMAAAMPTSPMPSAPTVAAIDFRRGTQPLTPALSPAGRGSFDAAPSPSRGEGWGEGLGGSGFSAARTTSGVNGGARKRTPVASKIAFAIAAVPGTDDDSPAPSGGSPGRGISITSTTGTSRKLRIG
jgi:hypothetical protein